MTDDLTAATTLCEQAQDRLAEQFGRIAAYDRYLSHYFQESSGHTVDAALKNYSDGRPALRAQGETATGRERAAPNYIKPIVKDLVAVRGGWPSVTVPPASAEQADQQKAVLITRALRQQHDHSSMVKQQQRSGFFLSCLGDSVYTLDPRTPDMDKQDPDPFKPVGIYFNVVNPRQAFPKFRAGSDDLENLFVIDHITREDARLAYPGVSIKDNDEQPWVDLIHYYSRTERQTIVDGSRAYGINHGLGFCPAEWVYNEATDGRFAQADIAGAVELHAELQDLWRVYVDSLVGAVYPIYVIHDQENTQGQLEYGPGAQFTTTGTGSVTVLAPQANPQAAQLIFESARNNLMQQTGVSPVRIEGQVPHSNTSARSVDRQQAPQEQRLKLSLGLLTEGLQRVNSKCLLMLSKIPEFADTEMELYGQDRQGSYHQTFTGTDIGGWTRNIVKWDAMLGTTQQERSVQALQLYKEGQGDFPFTAVLEASGDDDPTATIARGRDEMKARMANQQQMQPQQPPGGPGPPQPGDPQSAAHDQMSLAAGGGGGAPGAPPGGAPVQPPPPAGGIPNFGAVDTPPSQPGLGSPAPTPDVKATIEQVLATLSLRGTAEVDLNKGGYTVLVSDFKDIPAVKAALKPVQGELNVTINVRAKE